MNTIEKLQELDLLWRVRGSPKSGFTVETEKGVLVYPVDSYFHGRKLAKAHNRALFNLIQLDPQVVALLAVADKALDRIVDDFYQHMASKEDSPINKAD